MILAPYLRQRFVDANANPLAGGFLYTYVAGTTTPLTTYTDQAGTENENPIELDANGECDLWLDESLAYKFSLTDADDVPIYTIDHVLITAGIPGWSAGTTYSTGDVVQDASGFGLLYVSLIDNNLGHALSVVADWRRLGGGIRTLTASTTLVSTDEFIRSNTTAGNKTMTLPAIVTTPVGTKITIKDVGTGGFATTVKGSGSDLIDGINTWATTLAQYDSVTVLCTGTVWDII